MADYTPGTPPPLPAEAVRKALGEGNLDAVEAYLDAHDRAVRQLLPPDEAATLDARQRQAWLNLIEEQQALYAELGQLRDHTADQLQQLQRHQRGASAYLQAME